MKQLEFKAGMLSVSFRDLGALEVIEMTREAGLEGIEWGGDIHAPPGDIQKAREIDTATKAAGLETSAYGSYYRLGERERSVVEEEFGKVMLTASLIGAPLIRVWPGGKASARASEAEWQAIIEEARLLGDLAEKQGMKIGLEYHPDTLTDTNQTAEELMRRIHHPSVTIFWQPAPGKSIEERMAGLELILPYLSNVHVFHWGPSGGRDRRPLSEGREEWGRYVEFLRGTGMPRWLSLEFVKGDSREQFLEDARILKSVISATAFMPK